MTGDGEMLMGLGALATIGVKQPENLTIVVLDNGYYGETGMQVSHAGAGCDMTSVAKACGLAQAITVSTKDQLDATVPLLRQRGSTRFLRLLIAADEPPRVMPSRDGVEIKLRFQNAIGAHVA